MVRAGLRSQFPSSCYFSNFGGMIKTWLTWRILRSYWQMLPEFICNDTYQKRKWYTASVWYFGNIENINNWAIDVADKYLVTCTPDLPACPSLSTFFIQHHYCTWRRTRCAEFTCNIVNQPSRTCTLLIRATFARLHNFCPSCKT